MQHLSFYTLAALGRWWHDAWAGGRLIHTFTQTRDELVLLGKGPRPSDRAWFVRVGCGNPQYVVPVQGFRRAQTNSVDLFVPLAEARIAQIACLPGERELHLTLDDGSRLELRMHGLRSNVIWRGADGAIVDMFRKHLAPPAVTVPHGMPAIPDGTPIEALKRHWPWLDAPLLAAIAHEAAEGSPLPQAADRVARAAQEAPWTVCQRGGAAEFHLLPPADAHGCTAYTSLPEALEAWLRLHLGRGALATERAALLTQVQRQVQRWRGRHASLVHTLGTLATQRSAEELGHLLMAALHLVEPGAEAVTVPDWYREGAETVIALDPLLNAQQNAEHLYRQHRDRQRRQAVAQQQLAEAETLLAQLAEAEAAVAAATHVGLVRQLAQRLQPLLQQAQQQSAGPEKPYHEFVHQGWRIWVGRGADRNDRLTFAHARKDDLWLHARDVPGAHVVIKTQPGQSPPPSVVEHAAGLALHFSRNRTATLAPVSVTPRKYVRKHKKLGPGQVVLDRETVLVVPPVAPPAMYDLG